MLSIFPDAESDDPIRDYHGKLRQMVQDHPHLMKNLSSAPGRCLLAFLAGAGWQGSARKIIETLPHVDPVDEIDALRVMLTQMGYPTWRRDMSMYEITKDMLPCLLVGEHGDLYVIANVEDGGNITLFDAQEDKFIDSDSVALSGEIYCISSLSQEQDGESIKKYGWGYVFISRMRHLIRQLFWTSFVVNLLALGTPLFVMQIYDKAIGASSMELVYYLSAGIVLVLIAESMLRRKRSQAQAYLGARWESLAGTAAFEQLLYMPLGMTERSSVSAQIARLRQFDSVRDLFAGQVGTALMDTPYLLLFIGIIAAIGGSLVFLPMSIMLVYAVIGVIVYPIARTRVAEAGEARNELLSFLTEMISQHRTLSESWVHDVWARRYTRLVTKASIADFRTQQLNHRLQIVAQTITTISGVATLGVGAVLVMHEAMTLGALIAVMALIWRVLAPLQTLFLSGSTMSQGLKSLQELNRLMRIAPEGLPEATPAVSRRFEGAYVFDRVSFRYGRESEPALLGVTAKVEPGSLIAITGPNGAGKSTLLKLANRLYAPQAGTVMLDGLDLRQFDPREIRYAVRYMPQHISLFHGTIAQNLRLSDPEASDEAIDRVLDETGVMNFVEDLPDGRDTIMSAAVRSSLPDGVLQRIGLARVFLQESSIYLMDEPASKLDDEGDAYLMQKLKDLHGKATVIMITARPSHMRMADRLLYIHRGQLLKDEKPEIILPSILAAA